MDTVDLTVWNNGRCSSVELCAWGLWPELLGWTSYFLLFWEVGFKGIRYLPPLLKNLEHVLQNLLSYFQLVRSVHQETKEKSLSVTVLNLPTWTIVYISWDSFAPWRSWLSFFLLKMIIVSMCITIRHEHTGGLQAVCLTLHPCYSIVTSQSLLLEMIGIKRNHIYSEM